MEPNQWFETTKSELLTNEERISLGYKVNRGSVENGKADLDTLW